MSDNGQSRRSFLGALGSTAATFAFAGCVSRETERSMQSSPSSAASTAAPAASPPDVEVHEDLTFADRPEGEVKLDLYVPDTEDPSPLVVWFHGGGWLVNTRKTTPGLEEYFANDGYAMASVSYRLAPVPDDIDPVIAPSPDNPTPRATFPAQILDAKASVRWLRAHADEYGYDAENVAVWGASSGAHVAALTGTVDDVADVAGDVYDDAAVEKTVHPEESGRVQGVVAWYPPTDFLRMDPQLDGEGFSHDAPNSPESLLVGGQITEHEDRVRRASPLTYVSADDPPFVLMHGRQDTTVPYEQSTLLYDALNEARVDTTYYVLHELGHGFYFDPLSEERPADQSVAATGHYSPETERSPGTTAVPSDGAPSGTSSETSPETPSETPPGTPPAATAEETPRTLVERHPPAGATAIAEFFERTLAEREGSPAPTDRGATSEDA